MLEAKGIGDGAITSAKIKDGTIAKGDLAVALQAYLGNCIHRTYAAGAGLATCLAEVTALAASFAVVMARSAISLVLRVWDL